MKKIMIFVAVLLCVALLASCTLINSNSNSGDGANQNDDKTNGGQETVKPDPEMKTIANPLNVYTAFDAYESENGMPYRLYEPAAYDEKYAYPVVLFLHGAGERGTDNEGPLLHVLQDWFNDVESPIYQSIVIVPQCPENEQWVNTPWGDGSYDSDAVGESDAILEALAILDSVCDEYSINPNRIYVAGLSMGGYGTWNLLMNHSDLFAAGMPICGAADPSKAEVLKDMPIAAFHGDRDSVVPVAGTRDMYQAIVDAGGENIHYYEVPDTDHNSWSYAASRGDVLRWIFDQRRTDK